MCSAALVVLGVDMRAAWDRPIGAVAIPVLAILMVLAVATALLALVALAAQPDLPLRQLVRACLYLAVRYWYLTAASLAVMGLLELLLSTSPAIALGVAATPLLYVVWANSRYSLRPALGVEPGTEPLTNRR
jgi:uncharacterized membrane protein YesL